MEPDLVAEWLERTISYIAAAKPDWRERFEVYWKLQSASFKKRLADAFIGAALRENNPTDYPRLIEVIKDALPLFDNLGSEDKYKAAYLAALVRLLIIVGKTGEAITYFPQLRALTKSRDIKVRNEAKQYVLLLRQKYSVLR